MRNYFGNWKLVLPNLNSNKYANDNYHWACWDNLRSYSAYLCAVWIKPDIFCFNIESKTWFKLSPIKWLFIKVSYHPSISKPVLFLFPTFNKNCWPNCNNKTVNNIKSWISLIQILTSGKSVCFYKLSNLNKPTKNTKETWNK